MGQAERKTKLAPPVFVAEEDIDAILKEVGINDFLGNFITLFPISPKVADGELDMRRYIRTQGQLETKIGAKMNPQDHSQRFLNSTWREFFADIDKALKEEGKTLASVRNQRAMLAKIDDPATWEKFNELARWGLLPIYRRLRKYGYTHRDLTI